MIYLLEDDESIRKLVLYALESQGFEAAGFERPSAFWAAVAEGLPSLVLLDVMLPEEDGVSILKRLKARPETAAVPVIMLTAKGSEYDRVVGLDAGADDYVVKPFGILELLARVRAVLRRVEKPEGETLRVGRLTVSPERHEVTADGESVALTNKEFALLLLLAQHPGRALDRSLLLDRIWDLGSEPENRTLDVHVRTLRAKLGPAGEQIETVRGVGYRLRGD